MGAFYILEEGASTEPRIRNNFRLDGEAEKTISEPDLTGIGINPGSGIKPLEIHLPGC
jgi:hypothetical protein